MGLLVFAAFPNREAVVLTLMRAAILSVEISYRSLVIFTPSIFSSSPE